MRIVNADEVEELFYKQVEYGATDLMDAFDDALNDAQTIIPNCPKDCRWRGKRHQRCSCCRRNLFMKDSYEKGERREENEHDRMGKKRNRNRMQA